MIDAVRYLVDNGIKALREPDTLCKEFAIRATLGPVHEPLPVLLGRHWTVEVARKPQFLTSDAPLVLWRKPSPRDAFMGFGLQDAEEVRFPLDPGKQLVLALEERSEVREVKPRRVWECNQDLADTCHRFIVTNPDRHEGLDRLPLDTRGPRMRFSSGPGYRDQPDGSTLEMGEVLHTWIDRRPPRDARSRKGR